MRTNLIFVIGLLTSCWGLEFENINRVYDGDTFYVDLKCTEEILCKNVPIRVKGIDCPEIKGKSPKEKELALRAKSYTTNFLKIPNIRLENCTRDKYFRLDCEVKAGEYDLSQLLLQNNLAVEYDGGTKIKDWSK